MASNEIKVGDIYYDPAAKIKYIIESILSDGIYSVRIQGVYSIFNDSLDMKEISILADLKISNMSRLEKIIYKVEDIK